MEAPSILTAALCKESSGEDSLPHITTLVLRGMGLSSIPRNTATLLSNLSSLSLSHNKFDRVDYFDKLSALRDLNLNFNSLTSSCLATLGSLPALRSLYLSNNSLSDDCFPYFSRTGAFPRLEVLGLFKNKLSDLEAAKVAVSALVRLKDLTLEGNELAGAKGYRGAIIRSAKALAVLDGDEIEDLDFELAEDGGEAEEQVQAAPNVPKLKLGAVGGATAGEDGGKAAVLNSDPVLLTYRASAVLGSGGREDESDSDGEGAGDKKRIMDLAKDLGGKKKRGIVGKLRGTSVSQNKGGSAGSAIAKEEPAETMGDTDLLQAAAMLNIRGAALADLRDEENVSDEAHADPELDVSDPWEILRRVLVKCEGLEAENKKLKRHQMAGGGGIGVDEVESVKKELEDLRSENANMYLLRDESKELKREIAGVRAENAELRLQLARGRQGVPSLDFGGGIGGNVGSAWGEQLPAYPDVAFPTPRSSESGGSSRVGSRPGTAGSSRGGSRPGSGGGGGGGRRTLYQDPDVERPQTACERIESGYLQKLREEAGLSVDNPNDESAWGNEEDDEDNEILDLIERNENGLAKIRQDLVEANKEIGSWEKGRGGAGAGAGGGGRGGEGKENEGGKGAAAGKGGGKVKGPSVRELLELRKRAAAGRK